MSTSGQCYLPASYCSLARFKDSERVSKAHKERHGELIAAQFAPDISRYLAGDEHALTEMRRALIATVQEAESQVIIITMRAPHRTSPDGATGNVIATAARNLIDSINTLTTT